jgi:hypothetical protein
VNLVSFALDDIQLLGARLSISERMLTCPSEDKCHLHKLLSDGKATPQPSAWRLRVQAGVPFADLVFDELFSGPHTWCPSSREVFRTSEAGGYRHQARQMSGTMTQNPPKRIVPWPGTQQVRHTDPGGIPAGIADVVRDKQELFQASLLSFSRLLLTWAPYFE